eukprot:CAMPEP_0203952154 /NCGR_PEP_ID=MMETSP0359-20131031/85867_1 /ASSEMBLY_ACC=CAM_ASM_000338 /TAXON_ID=268821 /ORGANISM="Scrippsiella Hangoei, Strain SHTV-5" /LENGTH=51 /DNA_ID=CAMNT_0050885039 /DNA_START=11 /DNA_END=163 /DNA_ORIENTATION=+
MASSTPREEQQALRRKPQWRGPQQGGPRSEHKAQVVERQMKTPSSNLSMQA